LTLDRIAGEDSKLPPEHSRYLSSLRDFVGTAVQKDDDSVQENEIVFKAPEEGDWLQVGLCTACAFVSGLAVACRRVC